MLLEGSCHCGKVRFSLESAQPWPYQRCYCSICRKTGGSGYMINVGGDAATLRVEGREHLGVYQAVVERNGKRAQSRHHRNFCRECGSHLWAAHEAWPDLVHPVASAIDTPLPPAPAHVHMMLGSKPAWVPVDEGPNDACFDEYPELSLADWHREHDYREPAPLP
jgi:hypothetical protein